MFGLGGDMMKKLQEMQSKVQESKEKLNTIIVEEHVPGKIKLSMNGNRELKEINIEGFEQMEKEELEDFLVLSLNKLIEKANHIQESEMAASAKGMFPNM